MFGPRWGTLIAVVNLVLMDQLLAASGTLAGADMAHIREKLIAAYILIMATGVMLETLHRRMQHQLTVALDDS